MKTKAMKTEVWYLIMGVVFLLGSGLAVVSTAGAQDNGIMWEVESGPMIEGPIGSEINRNWLEFGFSSVGVPATGCSPADPAGPGCGSSSGGNSVFTDAPPWTFTAPPSGVVLTITDAFLIGDQFEVFDSGNSLGLTSVPSTAGYCGSNPDLCFPDPNSSSGTFNLRPGPHSISITPTASPFGGGAAYFRIDEIDEKPLSYFPVKPCRVVDTRKGGGIIGHAVQRNFRVYGSASVITPQGGNPAGCPSPFGEPLAAHINMVAVDPTGKGNLQAFPIGAGVGAGLSVNYNTIDTNLANAGTVKTVTGAGADITVTSRFSSAHTAIDVLGYYYSNGDLLYTAVKPCRIVDTRKTTEGILNAFSYRQFYVSGSSSIIESQGGNPDGCPSPLGQPLAVHINMVAANPADKGNLQAYPAGAGPGAGLSVNYNAIDTNLANAGTVKTNTSGTVKDITLTSRFSSTHAVIDVLGYYYPDGELSYIPVTPCRIVDTRKTTEGILNAFSYRQFYVSGSSSIIESQGGNPYGCISPLGQPLAAHINMVAANPAGKGNLQAYPVGAGPGAGLSVNYNAIDTNLANAGTVKTNTSGTVKDITLTSRFSSTHAVIDVLGYYYPAP